MDDSDFSWEVNHTVVLKGFDCSPAELSRRLGLRPTRVRVAGQPLRPGRPQLVKQSVWIRDTAMWKGGTAGVNAQRHLRALSRLVERMHARRRVISRLVPVGGCEFTSRVYTNSPNVISHLPLSLARMVVELNAEWSCSVWSPKRLSKVLSA